MGANDQDLAATVERWLTDLESALASADTVALANLFRSDCHWRDLLALTWQIRTFSGAAAVAAALGAHAPGARASGFRLDRSRTPPRRVTRAGSDGVIESLIAFDTARGRGAGVLRLRGEDGGRRAWTLSTSLESLAGFEEAVGANRPSGEVYSRDFSGPNWLDRRNAAREYADRDPAVLVVGDGHAGLSIAARLGARGVDALVVDRGERVGDNWRKRYHALTLHNRVNVNHLPYMPFPPGWPSYVPKDKLANWLEAYAEAMEINFWTATEFAGAAWDERNGGWTVKLERAGGAARELHPRHIVMATGVSGAPNRPALAGLGDFAGTVVHSHEYAEAAAWRGRRALVIGTGNSGHDIAQDLHSNGAQVVLVQRSPTHIVGIEPSAQLPYTLYAEGPPLEDCDQIVAGTPFALVRKAHRLLTERASVIDRRLLEDLARVGFRTDSGEEGTGWQFRYLTRGGGYYFNVGCSDLIVERKIGLVQLSDIERFVAGGARLKDGRTLEAELVVLATGYKGPRHLVARLFGEQVAQRVGPVWGFDAEGAELRNMFVRTAQPGLWFIAGSFAQCRIYSRYLALQIKACETGRIPLVAA